jgi:hypothetical protein
MKQIVTTFIETLTKVGSRDEGIITTSICTSPSLTTPSFVQSYGSQGHDLLSYYIWLAVKPVLLIENIFDSANNRPQCLGARVNLDRIEETFRPLFNDGRGTSGAWEANSSQVIFVEQNHKLD